MPEFSYYAVDQSGTAVHGVMVADDEWKLEERLHDIGYWLIEAKEQARQRSKKRSKVSRRELIDFFNGMSALLAAGVTAVDSFKAMVEEADNEAFKRVLEDIEVSVQAGNSIHESMLKNRHVFSDHICNLIHAGEYSGNLATTFNDLSEHLEWVDRLMADVKQASIYPGMVMLAVAGLISLLLVFVVPKFTVVFNDFGMELPALTQVVVTLGNYWWMVCLGFLVSILLVWIAAKFVPGMDVKVDAFKFNIPVFGHINRMLVMSRFVHNLALLVKAGVPILQALSLCRRLVASPVMEKAVKEAELAVNEGKRMSDALRDHEIVSPLVLRMIVVGEETGKLDEALHHVSMRFDTEIPRRIKRAFGIMEPVIILMLIVIVGLIASAVFLPMVSLMSGIL